MATAIVVPNRSYKRLDDRISTFGNTEFFECAPDIIVLPPGNPRKYCTAIVGLTSSGSINGPLIMAVLEVWNFGVHLHRSQLFPGGLPAGYEELLWDVWAVGSDSPVTLLVGGVQS